jgi:hypothetical protein
VEVEAYMKDKQLIVKVFNQVGTGLQNPDLIAWKNIDILDKKKVSPGGAPAEFGFGLEESLKEVKITADPAKRSGKRAFLKIVLSSIIDFDAAVKFSQKDNENKWIVGFTGMTPGPNDGRLIDPPVVNVTVGEDEDPNPASPPKPKPAKT